jgi:hypothetical protein
VLNGLAAFEVQGPGLALNGARQAAVGTGVLGAEDLGLALKEDGEGALRQAPGGLLGHLFQGREVGVQPRALLAEGAPGDDFSPAGRQFADFLEVFGAHSSVRHDLPSLALAPATPDAFFLPFYVKGPASAK